MKEYIEKNKERFYEELFSLLRIPSVSALPEHKQDILRCADRWVELLLAAGVDEAKICPTKGNPVVFAQKMIDPSYTTVLVYGHYDVQPAEPLEKWATDPFEPVIQDGEIWGRGADDDKGQSFMHAKAFEYMLSTGQLKHNVKFILEGEEEVGSQSLSEWIRHPENAGMLKADVILVSDTTMLSDKIPSINCGMRGVTYVEVDVTGPSRDVHSGHYGGAVADPINVLCDMISSLVDKDGHITVPGFYDDVDELSVADRAQLARAPFDLDEYKKSLNIDDVTGEKGYSVLERESIRPCLDVCGMWGGYTGPGCKTVIPSTAHAKISMRLVPNQDCHKVVKLVMEHIKNIAPACVKVDVREGDGGNCFLIPITSHAFQAASKAVKEVYGVEPVPSRGGGSIPILAEMRNVLGIDPLLMGFGLESDVIHSPNENYPLSQFFAGMESIALFYKYY